MRYSLLSRFEGCLLGAVVAERLGAAYEANAVDLQKSAWFGVGNKSLSSSRLSSPGIIIQKHTAEILIKEGFVQKSFWQSLGEKDNLDVVDVVLAILPLILYLHDQELKKKLSLQEACVNLSKGEFTEQMVVVLGHGISLALQEKLRASRLIGQMVARLQQEFGGGECLLGQQLSKIQPVLEDNAGLERVEQVAKTDAVKGQTMVGREILGQMLSVATGLDSFVAYSEDFRLCVMRALRTGKSPRLSALFAGALGGAYGGVGSIPVAWIEALCGLELGSERMPVLEMARRLFAAWSGVYQNQGSMIEANRFGAVAASELLRRR